ncbi:helix-turn-helix transcriptional regulator [Streptomyces sp. BBFR2]|uniref:helix-turn-helix transcriptional regulator n=1 Tax=Streptomyces sp. BBFR2 TaxID=3372854 RepID=UPI0037D9C63A
MRAARLIKMVLLLQSRPSLTAGELARELEVSERTVARDVLSLSEAGVPVYADRGRTGGYRLVGGYRTRLTGLGRSEAETLFLSGVPSALREMGLADAASAARLKVSAALLPELREAASGAAQRFHLDAPAWFRTPETPAELPAVAEAVWGDHPIRARYLRKDHEGQRGVEREVERELEPYGLVLKAGVWYLAARVGSSGTGAPGGGGAGSAVPGGGGAGSAVGGGGAPGPAEAAGTGAPGPVGGAGAGSSAAAGHSSPAAVASHGSTAAAAGHDGPAGVAGHGGSTQGPGGGVAGPPGGPATAASGAPFRIYRVDRFTGVAVAEGRFVRDAGFDLPGFWAERAAQFARSLLRTEVLLRLTERGIRQLPYVTEPAAAREAVAGARGPEDDGRWTLTLAVEDAEVAYAQLLGLGPECEVLAPEPLRARFTAAARRMAERYGG